MRERIDISEVETQTKIRAKYLRAIENEEWDLLPGTVYAKSFLRTYGDYLGLDSRMLIDEFRRRYERSSEHDSRPARSRRERQRRAPPRRAPAWAPIAAVVVVVLAVLFAVGELSPGSNNNNSPSAKRPVTEHHRHQGALPKATATTPAPPTKVTLKMIPTNAVYVCLVNGAGTKLINEQTFAAGQTIPTEKASRLLLTLGNNNVQMKIDGKPWPVSASAAAIRLLITPGRVRHISLAQHPTCP